MPIYEYRCRACHHDFERYLPTPTASGVSCPTCASDDVMRKLSVFGMKSEGAAVAGSFSGGGGCCGGGCSCH
jgi:putative FmdB family regulatory protein